MKTQNRGSYNKRMGSFFCCFVILLFGIIGVVNSISQDLNHHLTLWAAPKGSTLESIENKKFSQSIAVGDVNGDGFDDVVVSSVKYIYIYDGSFITDLSIEWAYYSNDPMIMIENSSKSDSFNDVALADVNNDNIMDVIVGVDPANVYAFYGKPAWTSSSSPLELDVSTHSDWSIDGTTSGSDGEFGSSLANTGDVNADGIDDIIVGSPGDGGKGKAYIFYGSSKGLPADHNPDAKIPPGYELTQSGMKYRIDDLGSIVGKDGHFINNGSVSDNFIIGIPMADIDMSNDGFFEKPDAGVALIGLRYWCLSGDNYANSRFGYALGSAGDVNGDGHPEVLVCSRKMGSNPQKVFLYIGDSDRIKTDGDPLYQWSVAGFPYVQYSISGVTFEPTVGSAGDINGDGYGDIFIGDYTYDPDETDGKDGRVHIWYGGAPTATDLSGLGENQTPDSADIILYPQGTWAISFTSFGYSAESGDINGDGFSDIVVGDPYCYHPSGGYEVGVKTGAVHIYFSNAAGEPELPVPTNLSALNGYHNAVPIAWGVPEAESYTGYNVYRGASSGGSYTKIASNINHQYYRDENVVNGQTYYYKVTAVYAEGKSDFTSSVSGSPITNGYKISSDSAQSVPNFDGVINTSEWVDATQTVITYPGKPDAVTLYTMNMNNHLYFAVDDQGNTALDNYDTFGIIFDENRNREWPSTNTGEEGILQLFWNGSNPVSSFSGFYGTWPDQVDGSSWSTPSGINLGFSASSGHVQIEASLDLSSSPLNVSTAGEFGVLFYTYEGGGSGFTGTWPQEIAVKLPSLTSGNAWAHGPFSYGDLKLVDNTPSSVESDATIQPKEFALSQNYPNPFNPSTVFPISIDKRGQVRLSVADVLGRETALLVDTILEPGTYKVRWNPQHLSNGIYVVRLQSENRVMVRKCVYMK